MLFASHTAETSVFRVGSHHLSRQLALMGVRVGHLSTPLSPVKLLGAGDRTGLRGRWQAWLQGPEGDDAGRRSAVPFTVIPVQATAGLPGNLALLTAVPSLRSTARRMQLDPVDYLVVDQPLFAGLGGRLRARKIVYRPTDVYLSPRLQAAQARMLAQADGVVATSDGVLAALPDMAADLPRRVLSNGVDTKAFVYRADEPARAASVVYVGALDDRVDWQWLTDFASCVPDVAVDLFGPVSSTVPDGLPGNVHLKGPAAYSALAGTLSGYTVALMPFGAGAANAGRSPMKLYEYLATGLHVVATPGFATAATPPPGVHVVSDGRTAAGVALTLLDTPGRNAAGVSAATTQDWSHRAHALLAFLDGL